MGMELKRNYDTPEFHDDLRRMYMRAGVNYEDTVFLFTDTQITKEEFLEDINNILNSGTKYFLTYVFYFVSCFHTQIVFNGTLSFV